MKKIIILALCFFATSCGTMFGGKTQSVRFETSDGSTEVEADIISGGGIMSTHKLPTIIVVNRSNTGIIVKVKESKCYKASQSVYESKMNGFFFLNLLGSSSSSTSTTIDSITGAIWTYDKRAVVNVKKKPSCKKQ